MNKDITQKEYVNAYQWWISPHVPEDWKKQQCRMRERMKHKTSFLIFETHATSVDNERLVSSGQYDAELSPLGQAQAVELGARYRAEHLGVVLCSDLQRSYRTAEIAFAHRDLPIHRDARIRECDYGAWTKRPAAEIDAERVRHIFEPFPGGESYAEVAARMRDLLGEVARGWAGKRVLIIGHRATWYSLEHLVNGRDLRDVISGPWTWQPGWTYHLRL